MLVNLRRRPPDFGIAKETVKIAGAAFVATVSVALFAFLPARRFAGLQLMARVMGKLAAVIGRRHYEYKVIHGA
jgi:hypothetical protein